MSSTITANRKVFTRPTAALALLASSVILLSACSSTETQDQASVEPEQISAPVATQEPVQEKQKQAIAVPIEKQVLFEFDSAKLNSEAVHVLQEVTEKVTTSESQSLTIHISGHTDATGPDVYNQTLSKQRAESVKDYLQKQLPAQTEINWQVSSYGENKPVADNDTRSGREKNRRTVIEFTYEQLAWVETDK